MGTSGDALEGPLSLRYAFADPITANLEGAVTFEAPELPEETLMEVGISQGLAGAKDGEIKQIQKSNDSMLAAKGIASKDGFKKAGPVQGSESPGHVEYSDF